MMSENTNTVKQYIKNPKGASVVMLNDIGPKSRTHLVELHNARSRQLSVFPCPPVRGAR